MKLEKSNGAREHVAPGNMSGVTRRTVMSTVALFPSIVASIGACNAAADEGRLETLWRRRKFLVRKLAKASADHDEAVSKLPEWARSGPKWMDFDGNKTGGFCGWPEVENPTPPQIEGAYRRIRISPDDVKEEFRTHLRTFGTRGPGWKAARSSYVQRLKKVRARVAEQKRLEEEAGVNSFLDLIDRISDAIFDVEEAISRLSASSLIGMAALILIKADVDDNRQDWACLLRPLCPYVSGIIAADVRAYLGGDDGSPEPIQALAAVA
jgi:hypothetical protein